MNVGVDDHLCALMPAVQFKFQPEDEKYKVASMLFAKHLHHLWQNYLKRAHGNVSTHLTNDTLYIHVVF